MKLKKYKPLASRKEDSGKGKTGVPNPHATAAPAGCTASCNGDHDGPCVKHMSPDSITKRDGYKRFDF